MWFWFEEEYFCLLKYIINNRIKTTRDKIIILLIFISISLSEEYFWIGAGDKSLTSLSFIILMIFSFFEPSKYPKVFA